MIRNPAARTLDSILDDGASGRRISAVDGQRLGEQADLSDLQKAADQRAAGPSSGSPRLLHRRGGTSTTRTCATSIAAFAPSIVGPVAPEVTRSPRSQLAQKIEETVRGRWNPDPAPGRPEPRSRDQLLRRPVPLDQGQLPRQPARPVGRRDPPTSPRSRT